MNDNLNKALDTLIEAAQVIKTEITPKGNELQWKKELETMIKENRTDTLAVFEKFTNVTDKKKEDEKEYCKKRVYASLSNFFDEPWQAQCLDDALEHLRRFIELTRR